MKSKTYLKLIIIAILVFACSTTKNNQQLTKSGSILLARKIPTLTSQIPTQFLSFMPVKISNNVLTFDIKTNQLTVKSDNKSIIFNALDASASSGNFTPMLTASEPSWYATDNYFTSRGLEVPANGSNERFLKGALGKNAIFFDKDLIIHSGKLHTDEIKGIRLSEDDMNFLVNHLNQNMILTIQ